MGVDQNAAQTFDAELLDEAHAAHVGGQVVDLDGVLADAAAVLLLAQVQAEAFDAVDLLIPPGQRFFVHGADFREALVVEVTHQGASDETTRPGDHNQVVLACGLAAVDAHKSSRVTYQKLS